MLGVFYFPKGTTWEELVPERDAVCSSALAFASSGEQISLYSPSPVQHPNPHARRILKHTTKHATIAHRPAANNYPYVLHFKRHNYSSYLQALLNRISPPSMHIPAPPVQTHIPSLSVWGGGGHFSDLDEWMSAQSFPYMHAAGGCGGGDKELLGLKSFFFPCCPPPVFVWLGPWPR